MSGGPAGLGWVWDPLPLCLNPPQRRGRGSGPSGGWGRPEIPGHARRDHPDDSRSTALQAQMGNPRLREARGFLKGPQLGRGRARPESYLRPPSLLLPGLRAPRTAAPFVQGHQQWRKRQAGGVSCAPTEDAKPWPRFTRLFLWAAFAREGPKGGAGCSPAATEHGPSQAQGSPPVTQVCARSSHLGPYRSHWDLEAGGDPTKHDAFSLPCVSDLGIPCLLPASARQEPVGLGTLCRVESDPRPHGWRRQSDGQSRAESQVGPGPLHNQDRAVRLPQSPLLPAPAWEPAAPPRN